MGYCTLKAISDTNSLTLEANPRPDFVGKAQPFEPLREGTVGSTPHRGGISSSKNRMRVMICLQRRMSGPQMQGPNTPLCDALGSPGDLSTNKKAVELCIR